jgi:hypothetical protein
VRSAAEPGVAAFAQEELASRTPFHRGRGPSRRRAEWGFAQRSGHFATNPDSSRNGTYCTIGWMRHRAGPETPQGEPQ